MSVSILKSEKTVVFVNSKTDVERITKNPPKNSLVVINGEQFHHSSNDFKLISYFCVAWRKYCNDIVYVKKGNAPIHIANFANAKIEIQEVNEVE